MPTASKRFQEVEKSGKCNILGRLLLTRIRTGSL